MGITKITEKPRNASIELLRVCMMFGIVLLHSITQAGHCHRGLDNVLMSCVDCFVFISGWYGMRFRVSKLIGLVSLALVSVFVASEFGEIFFGMEMPNLYLFCIQHFWFLWAYIVLMFIAPVMNAAVSSASGRALSEMMALTVFLVFGWSYACHVPGLKHYLPDVSGFGPYTFLTLVGVYAVARMLRKIVGEYMFCRSRLLIFALALLPLTAIGLGHYNSPFALGLACVVFFFAKSMSFDDKIVGRIARFVSPSMFGVFMLHSNGVGYLALRKAENLFVDEAGMSVYVAYILSSIIVFSVCVGLDMLRRALIFPIRPLLMRAGQRMDGTYDQLIDGVAKQFHQGN